MNKKILECPSCGEKLLINLLKCPKCSLSIQGDFRSCEFCQLPEEQFEFLKIYLRCEGNIKHIEKVLGISYPTVKSKITELLSILKLSPLEDNIDIYNAIADGKITVDEAVEILRQKKR